MIREEDGGARALRGLARDRPLITPEVHPSNDFYGHAAALKRYAGLSPRAALKVAIEHGITLGDGIWDVDAQARLPFFLCAGASRAQAVAGLLPPETQPVPIGPMVLYAAGRPAPPDRRSERILVAFPAHSTHHIDTDYDVEAFADVLVAQRRRFADVRVCLYWRDVQRGLHRQYIDRGLPCVTAGHIYDQRFLFRLHAILSDASAIITNEPGSHLVYAVTLGRPAWVVEQTITLRAPEHVRWRDTLGNPRKDHPRQIALRRLFAEPRDDLTAEQREFVAELSGADRFRDPPAMRALLLQAEATYRQSAPSALVARHAGRRALHFTVGRARGRAAALVRDATDRVATVR